MRYNLSLFRQKVGKMKYRCVWIDEFHHIQLGALTPSLDDTQGEANHKRDLGISVWVENEESEKIAA